MLQCVESKGLRALEEILELIRIDAALPKNTPRCQTAANQSQPASRAVLWRTLRVWQQLEKRSEINYWMLWQMTQSAPFIGKKQKSSSEIRFGHPYREWCFWSWSWGLDSCSSNCINTGKGQSVIQTNHRTHTNQPQQVNLAGKQLLRPLMIFEFHHCYRDLKPLN